MIIFIVIRSNHWAKGKSLTEAFKHYEEIMHEPLEKGEGYVLAIYKVKDEEAYTFIGVNDFGEITRKNKEDSQLYVGEETF